MPEWGRPQSARGSSAAPLPSRDREGADGVVSPPNPLSADLDHILSHTSELWDEFRGNRIFITGGTGFFGCWLLESFAWANDKLDLHSEAIVLTRDAAAFRQKAPHLAAHPAIAFHTGDIGSFDFPPGSFSHVIHAATESGSGLNERDPLRMLESIVEGTRRALDFAVACGAHKFLLTSSGAVYGKQPPELTHVPEIYSGAPDTMDPRSAYAEGKRLAELLCAIYHQRHGLETKIVRCFAFVGPHLPLDAHYAAGNFIRDALARQPIAIQGDGTPLRSYLYAADLAIWLWTTLVRGQACRPYNVGSENQVTIGELAFSVVNALAPRLPVEIAATPQPGAPAARYIPCTARAREELGLRQYASLDSGIRRTAARIGGPRRRIPLRSCGVCNGSSVEVVHHQDFALPENHPLHGGYDVVVCTACGFVYADTAVPQSTYDEFYKSLSKYQDDLTSTGAGESAWDAGRLAGMARRISELAVSSQARVLEIGCANGGLLRALAQLGFSGLLGIDPSPACIRNTKRRGIQARVGTLGAIPAATGAFDCIILSHVLEHVQDLGAALVNLRRLMAPGCIVYIEVPDATRYVDFLCSPFQDFNTEHINHFSCWHLSRLLSRSGLSCCKQAQITIPASAQADYPALWGAYRTAAKADDSLLPAYDGGLQASILRYIEASRKMMVELDRRLALQLADAPGVILWGTGQLAMKLLLETSLRNFPVAACVDGNRVNQGKQFAGAPVLAPEQIAGLEYPIVICTLLHERDIAARIRDLGLPNRIVSLAGSGALAEVMS